MHISSTKVTERPFNSGTSRSNHYLVDIPLSPLLPLIFVSNPCILLQTNSCFVSVKHFSYYCIILGLPSTQFAILGIFSPFSTI
ncbi:hypothetical protein BDQ17DRAFT_1373885 [Cyathus striatus]|nr:hypothetical protein BDQ17DRAFT_1373885 [Cyathus striatus]